jgi:hypothetical protein
MMANQHLATYLNNHLAASVAALDLLSSLETTQAKTDIARVASELRNEIEADQQELENLMERLQIAKNRPRQAVGWLGERFTQIKLRLDDSDDGPLHLLESLELLLIGIEGKRGLWRALAHASVPGLPLTDYERFAMRSETQQQRVEAMRLAAAKRAFSV